MAGADKYRAAVVSQAAWDAYRVKHYKYREKFNSPGGTQLTFMRYSSLFAVDALRSTVALYCDNVPHKCRNVDVFAYFATIPWIQEMITYQAWYDSKADSWKIHAVFYVNVPAALASDSLRARCKELYETVEAPDGKFESLEYTTIQAGPCTGTRWRLADKQEKDNNIILRMVQPPVHSVNGQKNGNDKGASSPQLSEDDEDTAPSPQLVAAAAAAQPAIETRFAEPPASMAFSPHAAGPHIEALPVFVNGALALMCPACKQRLPPMRTQPWQSTACWSPTY